MNILLGTLTGVGTLAIIGALVGAFLDGGVTRKDTVAAAIAGAGVGALLGAVGLVLCFGAWATVGFFTGEWS